MIGTDVRTTINEINSFERTSHSSYLLSIITPTIPVANEIQVLKIIIPDSNIDRNLIQNYLLNANKSSTGLFSLFNENQKIKIKSLGKDFSTDLISTLYYLLSNTTLNHTTSTTTSSSMITGLLNDGEGEGDQGFSVVQSTEKLNGENALCSFLIFLFLFSLSFVLFYFILFCSILFCFVLFSVLFDPFLWLLTHIFTLSLFHNLIPPNFRFHRLGSISVSWTVTFPENICYPELLKIIPSCNASEV